MRAVSNFANPAPAQINASPSHKGRTAAGNVRVAMKSTSASAAMAHHAAAPGLNRHAK